MAGHVAMLAGAGATYCSLVASAAVPADHVTPFVLQYIARSTTSSTPLLSTIAPNRLPVPAGSRGPIGTLTRLLGLSSTVCSRKTPVSSTSVIFAEPAVGDTLAIST